MGSLINNTNFGTWQCTAFGYSDTSNTIITTAYFITIGNVVQCTIAGTCDFSFVGGIPQFSVNLPLISNDPNLSGLCGTIQMRSGLVIPGTNSATLTFYDPLYSWPSFGGNLPFSAMFTYRII